MAKDDDKRLYDTVALVQRTLPGPQGGPFATLLQQRLMRSFASGDARAGLSHEIALGGWHIMDGAKRHLQRLYLLCERLFGGHDAAGYSAPAMAQTRLNLPSLSETHLKLQIAAIATNALGRNAPPGQTVYAESWAYALESERAPIESAISKAQRVLAQAYHGTRVLASDSKSKANFVKWFGPLDNLPAVQANIEAMYNRFIGIRLKVYYRGERCRGHLSDRPGPFFHATGMSAEGDYGYVVSDFSVVEPGFTHIVICVDFFSKAQDFPSDKSTPDAEDRAVAYSRAGVFVHEMAHAAWNAKDVYLDRATWADKATRGLTESNEGKVGLGGYGGRCAQILATRHPALALVNADNYRLFCDFYDNDHRT